jgi:hypothetical protein
MDVAPLKICETVNDCLHGRLPTGFEPIRVERIQLDSSSVLISHAVIDAITQRRDEVTTNQRTNATCFGRSSAVYVASRCTDDDVRLFQI